MSNIDIFAETISIEELIGVDNKEIENIIRDIDSESNKELGSNNWDCNMNSSFSYESYLLNIPHDSLQYLKECITEQVRLFVNEPNAIVSDDFKNVLDISLLSTPINSSI